MKSSALLHPTLKTLSLKRRVSNQTLLDSNTLTTKLDTPRTARTPSKTKENTGDASKHCLMKDSHQQSEPQLCKKHCSRVFNTEILGTVNLSAADLLVNRLSCFRIGSRNSESLKAVHFYFTSGSLVSTFADLKVISRLLLCLGFIFFFFYTKLMSKDYFSYYRSYSCCYHLRYIEGHVSHRLGEFPYVLQEYIEMVVGLAANSDAM